MLGGIVLAVGFGGVSVHREVYGGLGWLRLKFNILREKRSLKPFSSTFILGSESCNSSVNARSNHLNL